MLNRELLNGIISLSSMSLAPKAPYSIENSINTGLFELYWDEIFHRNLSTIKAKSFYSRVQPKQPSSDRQRIHPSGLDSGFVNRKLRFNNKLLYWGPRFETRRQQGLLLGSLCLKSTLPLIIWIHNLNHLIHVKHELDNCSFAINI